MALGCIVVIRKGKSSPPYELDKGEHTIGSSQTSNIRLKINNPLLLETHATIRVNENGVATIINKSIGAPVKVNGKVVYKPTILSHEDKFFILDKEFRYLNENLKYEPPDSDIFIKEKRNILASCRRSVMPLAKSPMKNAKTKTPSQRILNRSLRTPVSKSLNKSLKTPSNRKYSISASTRATSFKRSNATFDESTQDNNFNKTRSKSQSEKTTFEESTKEILPSLGSEKSMEIKSSFGDSEEVFSPVKPLSSRRSIRNSRNNLSVSASGGRSSGSKHRYSKRIISTFDESTQDKINQQNRKSTFDESTKKVSLNLSRERSLKSKNISEDNDEVFCLVRSLSSRKSIRNSQNNLSISATGGRSSVSKHGYSKEINAIFDESTQDNKLGEQSRKSTFDESTKEMSINLSAERSIKTKSISEGSDEVFIPVKPLSSRKSMRNSQNNLSISATGGRSSVSKHRYFKGINATFNESTQDNKLGEQSRKSTFDESTKEIKSVSEGSDEVFSPVKSISSRKSMRNSQENLFRAFSGRFLRKSPQEPSKEEISLSVSSSLDSSFKENFSRKDSNLEDTDFDMNVNESLNTSRTRSNTIEEKRSKRKSAPQSLLQRPNKSVKTEIDKTVKSSSTKRSIAAFRRSHAGYSTPKKVLLLKGMQKVNKSLPKDHVLLDMDKNSLQMQQDLEDVVINSAELTKKIFPRESNSAKENLVVGRRSTKRQHSLFDKDDINNSLKNESLCNEPSNTSEYTQISSLQASTRENSRETRLSAQEDFSVRVSATSKQKSFKRSISPFDESTQDNNLNQSKYKSQQEKSTFEESTKEMSNVSREMSTKFISINDSEEALSPVKPLSPKKSGRNSQNNSTISIASGRSTRSIKNSSNNSSLTMTSLEHSTSSVLSISSESFSSFRKIRSKEINVVDDTEIIDVVNITASTDTPDKKEFGTRILKTQSIEQHLLSQRPSITSQMFNDVSCTSTPFFKQYVKKESKGFDYSRSPKKFPKHGRNRSTSSNNVLEISEGVLGKRRSSRSVSKSGNDDCISCMHSSVKMSRSHSASSDKLSSRNSMNATAGTTRSSNRATSPVKRASIASIKTETPILHRVSQVLLEPDNTPEKLSSTEDETPKSHIKPTRRSSKANQSGYNPVTEDITPVTPEKFQVSGFTEEAFKTPINTPGLFESIRESAVRSRKRRRESNGSVLKNNKKARVDFLPEDNVSDSPQTLKIAKKRQQESPRNSLSNLEGVKKLMRTPPKSPKNDLSTIPNIRRIMSPKQQKIPVNDLTNVSGVANMFNLSGVEVLHQGSDIENSEDLFTQLTGKRPIRAYPRGKSLSPNKADLQESSNSRKTMGDLPICSPRVQQWVDEQVNYNVNTDQSSLNDGDIFTNTFERPEHRLRRGRSMSLKNIFNKTKRKNTLGDILKCTPNVDEWKAQQSTHEDKNALGASIANALDNISKNPKKTFRKGRSMSLTKSLQPEDDRRKTQGHLLKHTPNVTQWKSEHVDSTPEVQNTDESILKNVSDQPKRKPRTVKSLSPISKSQKDLERRKSHGDVLKSTQNDQWKLYKGNTPKLDITGEDENVFLNMSEKPNRKSRRQQSTSPKKITVDVNRRKTQGDILNSSPNVQEWKHKSENVSTDVEKTELRSSSGRHIRPNKSILNNDYVQFKTRKSSISNTSLQSLTVLASRELPTRIEQEKRQQKSPRNSLSNFEGLKKLMRTPPKSPKNDLSSVPNLRRIMSPKQQKLPVNDLTNVSGVANMFDLYNTPPQNLTVLASTSRDLFTNIEQLTSQESTNENMNVSPQDEEENKHQKKGLVADVTQVITSPSKKRTRNRQGKIKTDVLEEIEKIPLDIVHQKTKTRKAKPETPLSVENVHIEKANNEKMATRTTRQNTENDTFATNVIKPATKKKGKSKANKNQHQDAVLENENVAIEEQSTEIVPRTTRGRKKKVNSENIQSIEQKVTDFQENQEKVEENEMEGTEEIIETKKPTRGKGRKKATQKVEGVLAERVASRSRRKLKTDAEEKDNTNKERDQEEKVASETVQKLNEEAGDEKKEHVAKTLSNLKTDEFDNEQVQEEKVTTRTRRNLKTNNITQVNETPEGKTASRSKRVLKTNGVNKDTRDEEIQPESTKIRTLRTRKVKELFDSESEKTNKDDTPAKSPKKPTQGKTAKKGTNKQSKDTIEVIAEQQSDVKNTRILRKRKAKELPEEGIEFNNPIQEKADLSPVVEDIKETTATSAARKTRQRATKIENQATSTPETTTTLTKSEKRGAKPKNKVIEEIIEMDTDSPRTRAKRGTNKKYSSEEYELKEETKTRSKRNVRFQNEMSHPENSPEVQIKRTRTRK